MSELLEHCIKVWRDLEGVKPCNGMVFINEFIKFLRDVEEEDIEFDGVGSYFGKQINIEICRRFGVSNRLLDFEIAYSDIQIVVYTKNHNGFWVVPYINLRQGDNYFNELRVTLYGKLSQLFGVHINIGE